MIANQQRIKESNTALLFRLINQKETVSRAELAHMTGLSPTTVSSLIEELLVGNLILETGAGNSSTSGRKPIMLEINPFGGYVVSIELLVDGFNCFLYNLKCEKVTGGKFEIPDYSYAAKNIIDSIEEIMKCRSISEERLFGICIGIPAIFDPDNFTVISSTVLPINEGYDLYTAIKTRFENSTVMVGNESAFSAYAEKELGLDPDVKNLIFIDINIGIGAGVILGGKIFTGTFGIAGEIGHMTIDTNGPKCKCGNNGCLETLASIPAMIQKIVFGVMSGRKTVIKDLVKNDLNRIDINIVRKAVEENDDLVMEVIDDIAGKLAYGINNIINLLNPEIIVIGGEITCLGDELISRIREKAAFLEFKPNINKVKIRYSAIQDNIVTLGGARYMLNSIFYDIGSTAASLISGNA